METVCRGNAFNDGCKWEYGGGVADPASVWRWVRVDVTIKNTWTSSIRMSDEFDWAPVIGGRVYADGDYPTGVDDLRDVEFLPGSEVQVGAFMAVPKSAGTTNLLFAFRVSNKTWYYFKA